MTTTDSNSFGSSPKGVDDLRVRPPLVEGADQDFASITDSVARITEVEVPNTNKAWIISADSLAGPRVATILTRRCLRITGL